MKKIKSKLYKNYKIQEVISKGQILLVRDNEILKEKSSVPVIKKNEISFLLPTDNTDNINSARP